MLVNLLLQDGRANYMEGVMCECDAYPDHLSRALTRGCSDRTLPCYRPKLHCFLMCREKPMRRQQSGPGTAHVIGEEIAGEAGCVGEI